MLAYTKLQRNFGRSHTVTMEDLEWEGFKDAMKRYYSNVYLQYARVVPPPSVNEKKIRETLERGEQQVSARAWAVTVSPPEGTITAETFEKFCAETHRQKKMTCVWRACISENGHEHIHGILYINRHAEGKYLADILRWLKTKCIKGQTKCDPLHRDKDVENWVTYINDDTRNPQIKFS